ncbi:MAG TPA: branched-chain amino acid ABC transporter permease, partial [Actinomycetota bacterium]|nr:branched-chain amino acid ABC transporter permease [Actinomycetota bacterium]
MEEFLASTVRGLAQGSLYTLLGLGFVIVYRGTGVVNFAQPALMILGAYWTSYFALVVGLGFWPALAVAVLVTALIGAAVERIALRPMVGEPVFSATMVTVGVFIVLQVVAGDLIGLELRQVGHPWGLERTEVAGVVVFHSDLAKLVVTATVVALLWLFLRHSRLGLAMRAT